MPDSNALVPIRKVGQSIEPPTFFGRMFQPLTKRLAQAVVSQLSGGWFTPENPIAPIAPLTEGRRFDYPAGYNLRIRPQRESGITTDQLRTLAERWDLLRLVMETRKDQVSAFEWSIAPTKDKAKQKIPPEMQTRIDEVTEFFKSPDKRVDWHAWLRAIMEDMFVLDGVALWPTMKGNKLYAMERVDAATIKLVIDEKGRRPSPPYPAYQQILHGVVANEYRENEFRYYIRNIRNHTVFGFSHVEQIVLTIQIGLSRQMMHLGYFTEGNIPEAIAMAPETWTGDQIAQFQAWFDGMLSGNVEQRMGNLKFIPFGPKIEFLRKDEQMLKSEFDEWMARIVCYAFSVPPTPFIKQLNRATADNAKETAAEEGLHPLLNYLRGIVNDIIHTFFKYEDLEFRWNLQEDVDADTQSKIDDTYIKNGVLSIDEVRQRMGKEPLGVPNLIFTAQGPVPVSMYTGDNPTAPNLVLPAPQNNPSEEGDAEGEDASNKDGKDDGDDKKKPKEGSASSTPPFRKAQTSAHRRRRTY